MKALLGRKVGMTRVLDGDRLVAATVILAEPNAVTQVKTAERDGYTAVQLGAGDLETAKKPQQGHAKKANSVVGSRLKEFRFDGETAPDLGSSVTVATFASGDLVDVQGISRGHGFSGTIKRHHFKRGPKTHGSDNVRNPGSIGATYPQRVVPGRRMGGHMGAAKSTIRHLKVLNILPEQHVIVLKGAIPGIRGAWVTVTASTKQHAAPKADE